MRVPGSITTRRFLNNYNTSLEHLNQLTEQVTSSRKFNKVSENTAAASKAFLVRRQLARNEMYQSNLKNAKNLLTSAESSAMNVSDTLQLATKTLVKALNDPNATNRDVLASQMESYRDEILRTMNNTYAGRYIFSGTSNEAPFSLDAGNHLLFNGTPVSSTDSTEDFPLNQGIYVDIGLGIEYDPVTGVLDAQTALQISTSGVEFLGCGMDSEGFENNVCDALTSIANLLRAPSLDSERATKYLDKFSQQHSQVLESIADLGNRANYIDYNMERLSADTLTLQESQKSIELVDPAEAITSLKTEEAAYNACLQMGSRLIQKSLFDYLR